MLGVDCFTTAGLKEVIYLVAGNFIQESLTFLIVLRLEPRIYVSFPQV